MQWSLRFMPILGCSRTKEIPCPAKSLAAPIPDRRRSLGVSIAPAQRMTSFEAYPAQSSQYGDFLVAIRKGFTHGTLPQSVPLLSLLCLRRPLVERETPSGYGGSPVGVSGTQKMP